MLQAVLRWPCVWKHWVTWNWELLPLGLSLRPRAPKMQGNDRTDGPGGPSSAPDGIWAREFDSIIGCPCISTQSCSRLCVTLWNSVPKHEEQRFYFLNTQKHAHIRGADGLVWITGIKSFPQTSTHWMFHHFGWLGIFFFFFFAYT